MTHDQIEVFFATLQAANPQPRSELEYTSVFELLVAVLLSAQATDVSVNKATRRLFVQANTPRALLDMGLERLEASIKTIGLFRRKARHLLQTCQMLIDHHGGSVPRSAQALEALPGVGRKTANVVLNVAFGEPTMAVDTHIFRVSNRTGLAPGKTPMAVEMGLLRRVPERYAVESHHWLILHEQHPAIGQLERLEDGFGGERHVLVLGGGVVGAADRDQLDFLELMLADIPARVLARRSRLGTEARSECGQLDRQRGVGEDLLADAVGQADFAGRDQPVIFAGAERIFGELGQLSGAEHRFAAHQQRRRAFGETRGGLAVEHELPERALKPRHLPAQKGEARACDQRAGLEIEAERGAEIGVVGGGVVALALGAPRLLLDVTRLVLALGDILRRSVGQSFQQ